MTKTPLLTELEGTTTPMPRAASNSSPQVDRFATAAEPVPEAAPLPTPEVTTHVLERTASGSLASPSGQHTPRTVPKLGPNDFELLRVVGQGSFGKVHNHSS